MASRSPAETLAELRRCAPTRRRLARAPEPVALLARLLDACRAISVEERPDGLVIRLRADAVPALRLTCVLQQAQPAPLTAVETAVAEHICEGRTHAQIAQLRGVSVNTIKTQVRHIFRKLGVDSRVALVRRLAP